MIIIIALLIIIVLDFIGALMVLKIGFISLRISEFYTEKRAVFLLGLGLILMAFSLLTECIIYTLILILVHEGYYGAFFFPKFKFLWNISMFISIIAILLILMHYFSKEQLQSILFMLYLCSCFIILALPALFLSLKNKAWILSILLSTFIISFVIVSFSFAIGSGSLLIIGGLIKGLGSMMSMWVGKGRV